MTKYIVLDTETSGLNPDIHQILTVSLLLCVNDNILTEKLYHVQQQDWAKIDKKALEINGINLVEHNKIALSERDVILDILKEITVFGDEKPILLGQNINFDIGFVKKLFERNGVQYPFYYKALDTYSISMFLAECGTVTLKRFRLQDLCEHFNLTWGAHDALGDAKSTLEVYKKLKEVTCNSQQQFKS